MLHSQERYFHEKRLLQDLLCRSACFATNCNGSALLVLKSANSSSSLSPSSIWRAEGWRYERGRGVEQCPLARQKESSEKMNCKEPAETSPPRSLSLSARLGQSQASHLCPQQLQTDLFLGTTVRRICLLLAFIQTSS